MTTIDLKAAQQLLTQFGQQRVPMIGFCQASLVDLSPSHCEITLPLTDETKNHVDCMYFGALSVGADIAGGFLAMAIIDQTKQPIELLFKDFSADFKQRANGDTHFTCNDGQHIQTMIQQTLTTGERINHPIHVTATVPSVSLDPVATFTLTLSLKHKPSS